ncbi:MAG TPA: hypothetical protein VFW47_12910 [Phenylobacterium sp.]|nr:hypothetical protein [Phenylobacterium sp.]
MQRLLHRLSGDFLINTARRVATSVDRNLLTALILLTIVRYNVSVLTSSPHSARSYLGTGEIPPDELRLPISVYAVARALGLPYETVRRHVGKLKAAGLCISVAGGLIVPRKALGGAQSLAGVQQTLRAAQDFVDEAASFGIAARGEHAPPGKDVARQAVRLATDYCLDAISLMARAVNQDVVSVILLWAIAVANVDHLAHDPILAPTFGGLPDFVPDEERRPVTVYAVANFLLLPYETARRTLMALSEQGLVERRTGGMVVPTHVVARPEVVAATAKLAEMTEQFLRNLAEIGVVAQGADQPIASSTRSGNTLATLLSR